MKKRAELTLSIIVMAAIAVLVLLVMTIIFIRGANTGQSGILSCESKQGKCTTNDECEANWEKASWQCSKDGGQSRICCVEKGFFNGVRIDGSEEEKS